jgi:hypothetical protein
MIARTRSRELDVIRMAGSVSLIIWIGIGVGIGIVTAGCAGSIGDPGAGSGTGSGPGGAGNSSGGLPPVPADLAFVPEPAGLRRLTVPQYENSIRDLFGDALPATLATILEPDTELSGFASIGASIVGLSPRATEQFETAALDVAKAALANIGARPSLVGCAPSAATDDACTRRFIQTMGRRAWRRPLTEEEIVRYAALTKNAQTVLNDFFRGLEYGVAGLLQSPHFIYRQELGAPDAKDPSRVALDNHELATRLSYFLWNTTPDDLLLDAADANQLNSAAAVMTQAQRLLASPRVAAGMQTFFTELYRLRDLDSMPQLPSVFPLMTPTLGSAMRTETLRFLEEFAFGRNGMADFRDIFDARTTFVNAELARVYGLSGISGTSHLPVTLPDSGMRAGLLGQGSLLAVSSAANRGSPTRRGKFIREMLLCQGLPPAPPDIEPLPENTGVTARQKLEVHRSVESCRACHQAMDPIGLGLENFDGIGAFRTTDQGLPIDASGDLDGVPFSGPRELSAALKSHPDTAACIARNLYRYALGHVEGSGEEGVIRRVGKDFADGGYRFTAALEGVVQSPAFYYAAKPR